MKLRVNKSPISNVFQQKHYISWLVYGLSVLLIVILQSSPRLIPDFFGVRPSPLLPFVLCTAILGGARTGVTIGVFSGLLYGIFSTNLFGFDALVFMLLGLIVGLLVEWLFRANFYTALLLSFGGILVYCLIEWLFCYVIPGHPDIIAILLKVILPNGLYSFILAPVMYGFALLIARFVRHRVNG